MSSPSTTMTPASLARSYCRRRTWLGFTKCCVTCSFSACCSQWPNSLHCSIITHQQCHRQEKRGIAKKIIQAVRSLMISQGIDLVAGDFSVAAWRCHSRDNLSSTWRLWLVVPCLRRRAPHRCDVPDPFQTIGRTSVVFLSPPVLNTSGR